MVKTIETKFDKSVLPRWAQNDTAVVEKCKRNLSYRVNVCEAKTKQMRDMLKRQAQY